MTLVPNRHRLVSYNGCTTVKGGLRYFGRGPRTETHVDRSLCLFVFLSPSTPTRSQVRSGLQESILVGVGGRETRHWNPVLCTKRLGVERVDIICCYFEGKLSTTPNLF